MSTEPAIRIDNLVKRYAPAKGARGTMTEGKLALGGVSFDVPQGSIFGLLGPNGAGKSTLINILAGLVNKTSGSVDIWGFDIDEHRRNASRSIGIVPQEIVFDPFFTPFEVLENQAGFYGIPAALRRSEALLEAVRLSDKRDAYARTLSGGMKRRLLVAKAMVHSPPILVLDEPTAGVDIELRRSMWGFLTELNRQGITIILTTHYLEEAEQLCRNIGIIDHGRIVENTSMRELLMKLHVETFLLDLRQPLAAVPPLAGYPVQLVDPLTLEVQVEKSQGLNELFAQLAAQGIEVLSLRNKTNRLEELFVSLVAKNLAGGQ
jgi:ABC-2 type transport system ATP-binding protein